MPVLRKASDGESRVPGKREFLRLIFGKREFMNGNCFQRLDQMLDREIGGERLANVG